MKNKTIRKIVGWAIVGSFSLAVLYGFWLESGWVAIEAIALLAVGVAILLYGINLLLE